MKTYFSRAKVAGAGLTLALIARVNYQRIINYMQLTNDKAATYISFWLSTISRATLGGAAGQKVMLCTVTAGIVLNDIVIIQDVVDPTKFEINTMGAVAANVSYTLVNNLANTYASGAKVYGCVTGGGLSVADYIVPIGIATVERNNATAILVAEKDQAIYCAMDSCTATNNFLITGILRG